MSIDVKARAFVAAATGLSSELVIPGNDPHPAPDGLYATVLPIVLVSSGVDAEVTRQNSGITHLQTNRGRRFVTFSVQFYRSGAADCVEGLLSFPATTQGQIWLAEQNLTWSAASNVRNVSTLVNSKIEERWNVDITLVYQTNKQTDINTIDIVDIDLTISDSDDLTDNVRITNA